MVCSSTPAGTRYVTVTLGLIMPVQREMSFSSCASSTSLRASSSWMVTRRLWRLISSCSRLCLSTWGERSSVHDWVEVGQRDDGLEEEVQLVCLLLKHHRGLLHVLLGRVHQAEAAHGRQRAHIELVVTRRGGGRGNGVREVAGGVEVGEGVEWWAGGVGIAQTAAKATCGGAGDERGGRGIPLGGGDGGRRSGEGGGGRRRGWSGGGGGGRGCRFERGWGGGVQAGTMQKEDAKRADERRPASIEPAAVNTPQRRCCGAPHRAWSSEGAMREAASARRVEKMRESSSTSEKATAQWL